MTSDKEIYPLSIVKLQTQERGALKQDLFRVTFLCTSAHYQLVQVARFEFNIKHRTGPTMDFLPLYPV